jgi:signal transduction histidine kinase
VVAVTGSDLLPQVRKTRLRLAVYVTTILLVFLLLQALVSSLGITFFVGKQIDFALPDTEPSLSLGLQTYILFVLVITTAITWVFLSFLSWMVLYFNLKPVSQSIKDRDQFINNARHELRTPLTVLSSEVELFQNHTLSHKAQLDLVGISQQITRLKNLTQSLLTTLDGTKPHSTEYNLITNIKRIEAELLHIYESSNLFLDVVQQDISLIQINAVLFNQLLFNLLENAYKHAKPSTNIEISITQNPTQIIIVNSINPKTHPNLNGVGIQAVQSIAQQLGVQVVRNQNSQLYSAKVVL